MKQHTSMPAADLEQRAEVHRALGDPLRLSVVDALAESDYSPSELQQRLGITSNLLAHHLQALEAVGLLERHMSQGDRRRRYLSLTPAGGAVASPSAPIEAERVVFVCTHNSARSPLAAELWRHSGHTVAATSCGTHPAEQVHPLAVEAGRRVGMTIDHAPQDVRDLAQPGDIVITVCDQAHEDPETAQALAANVRAIMHWSIPDPVPDGRSEAFARTIEMLRPRIEDLALRTQSSRGHEGGSDDA